MLKQGIDHNVQFRLDPDTYEEVVRATLEESERLNVKLSVPKYLIRLIKETLRKEG